MRNTRASNRSRPSRNRRNRRSVNQHRHPIRYERKIKYQHSRTTEDGVLILSTRKRSLPTPEQLVERKRKKLQVQSNKVKQITLRHKIVNLYNHGAFFDKWHFPAKDCSNIITFLQEEYPIKYVKRKTAASFFYRTIKKAKASVENPALDPLRDQRGEGTKRPKRDNPRIVELCDELLSEENATAPKVKSGLQSNGFTVSLSTIYRIAGDLLFRWTKPWYTDVLTAAQKLKRKLFCARLLRLPDEALLRTICDWMFTDEKWWDIVGPEMSQYVKAGTKAEAKMQNQVLHILLFFIAFLFILMCVLSLCLQRKRHKSKKGGIQKRVYFWGGISWHLKTKGIAWTAADNKVLFRHTKNLCVGTVFEEEDDAGNPCVYRIVQTRAQAEDGNVSYVPHFEYPDEDPHPDLWEWSTYGEVKKWHAESRHVLVNRQDLQSPTCMQDTNKTLEIYEEALYPAMTKAGINQIVEGNASPHNNDTIRDSHQRHGLQIVGYTATDIEKEEIRELIREQTRGYRREQDKKAQLTKQTRELNRLPAWPPNSPDLNLIEIVWSWMVRWIRDSDGGWPTEPETLKVKVLAAWDAVPMERFREMLRSYRWRLMAIHSRDGDRHPNFA